MKTATMLLLMLGLCATASADTNELVITEIMYNTPNPPDNEYVEIYNHTAVTVDLTGWYLLDDNNDHDPCMLVGTLAPGDAFVVAGDPTLFGVAYPTVTNVNPNYFNVDDLGWALRDSGELIRLFNASLELVDSVHYDDAEPWPTEPNGNGPAMELIDTSLNNFLAASWGVTADGGTPGTYALSPVESATWGAIKAIYR